MRKLQAEGYLCWGRTRWKHPYTTTLTRQSHVLDSQNSSHPSKFYQVLAKLRTTVFRSIASSCQGLAHTSLLHARDDCLNASIWHPECHWLPLLVGFCWLWVVSSSAVTLWFGRSSSQTSAVPSWAPPRILARRMRTRSNHVTLPSWWRLRIFRLRTLSQSCRLTRPRRNCSGFRLLDPTRLSPPPLDYHPIPSPCRTPRP